jgi:hypothetical protein
MSSTIPLTLREMLSPDENSPCSDQQESMGHITLPGIDLNTSNL